MADVFISYASEDRNRVVPLAKALEEQGWTIFWDRTIPITKTWREVIYTELNAAKCVIVIWTENSRNSKWVLAEVSEAYEKDILTQILFDNTKVPFPFRQEQAADLRDWKAETRHLGFDLLLGALTEIVGPSPQKVKEAEQKQAEALHRRKQEEERQLREEEQRRTEEERQRKEEEQKRIEAARKAEEKQKRREETEAIKTDKPEAVKTKPLEPKLDVKATSGLKFPEVKRKISTTKLFLFAGIAIVLTVGVWLIRSELRKEKIESLLMSIHTQDEYNYENAKKELIEIGPAVIPAILRFLGDDLSDDLLEIVKKIGSKALPALIEGLLDESQIIRENALISFHYLEPATKIAAIPMLIDALRGKNIKLYEEPINLIDIVGTSEPIVKVAVPTLIEALKDRDERIRQQAALNLGLIGSDAKAALPALDKALSDEDVKVRENAEQAIKEIESNESPNTK